MSTGITILLVFIAVVVTLLIAVPVTRKIAVDNKIKQDAEKIGKIGRASCRERV